MKLILVFSAIVCTCVWAEHCRQATTDCKATSCAQTVNTTAHVECQNGDCTCVRNPKPCIIGSDCGDVSCIDGRGDHAKLHCFDNLCKCVNEV